MHDRVQEPFGGNVTNTGTTAVKLRLPGQYADAESGLYQNFNRDYDPSIGGYLQSDPIGLNGGTFGLHAYAGQNPIRWTDRSGLCFEDFCVGETLTAGCLTSPGLGLAGPGIFGERRHTLLTHIRRRE